MVIKKLICVLSLLCLLLLNTSVFADTENLCMYLPGFWYGSYTFLKHRDCRENRGCTHSFSAEVQHLSGTHYQADLTMQMGRREVINFTCMQSKISFDDKPDSVTQLSCANGACFVKYQDETLASTTIHVVT